MGGRPAHADACLPGNVAVPADIDGVETDSVVNVTQIATSTVVHWRIASARCRIG